MKRKVILVINCNCSAAIFQQVITTTFFKSQTATATPGMDFSHVRILHLFLLTKTFKNTGLSKGKTSLLLLWSLLCTCLCGENQCYNFVEKCDKIGDELCDQFIESPIIVTNIMIKFVRILVKWIGWKRCHKICGKNWWNIWCLILWTNSVTNYVTKRSPNWVTI